MPDLATILIAVGVTMHSCVILWSAFDAFGHATSPRAAGIAMGIAMLVNWVAALLLVSGIAVAAERSCCDCVPIEVGLHDQ